VCALIADRMKGHLCSSNAGARDGSASVRVTDAVLLPFLLLPALALRMELHHQRAWAARGLSGVARQQGNTQNTYHTVTVSMACLQMLRNWRELQLLVASTGAGAGAPGLHLGAGKGS
jgi:hypothetical protein